jgi:cytochrome c oxidase subunit I+III
MVVLMLVAGSIFACLVFAYFFLWTVSPGVWPRATGRALPAFWWPVGAAALLALSSGAIAYAGRALRDSTTRGPWPMRIALLAAIPLLLGALVIEIHGQWRSGLRPEDTGYAAAVYMTSALQGVFVATLLVMGLYTFARSLCGKLDSVQRATFDNTMLLWHYTVGQGLIGLAVVHLSPRLLG